MRIDNDDDPKALPDHELTAKGKEKAVEPEELEQEKVEETGPARIRGGADEDESNGNHRARFSSALTDDEAENEQPARRTHRRDLSQAQTLSSKSKAGRSFSLSEGKPAISELASSVRSEPPDHIDLEDAKIEPMPEAVEGPEPQAPRSSQDARTSASGGFRFPSLPGPSPSQIKSRFLEQFTNTTPSSGNGRPSVKSRESPPTGQTTQLQNIAKSQPKKEWELDWKQFLAETCWFYSQNTASVVLLLPRMAIALALYWSTTSSSPGANDLASYSGSPFASDGLGRDATWFSGGGEGLTGYGKCIVWLVIAWGLWRTLVLLVSW